MSTLSSANVTDVNLVLEERTNKIKWNILCINIPICMHILGNWPMPSYIMNISAIFHWNPSINYSDIASCETGANRQKQIDGCKFYPSAGKLQSTSLWPLPMTSDFDKKLIRRWDSERELSLPRNCTRRQKYNRLLHIFRHRSFSATQVYQIQRNNAM